jgi:DNA repair protein RecO (recombination protein O)
MEKSEAIVLRSIAWSETSSIVTLLTRTHGKVSGIAKGARRPKSSFEHALDLLAKSHVVFIAKSNDTLDLLTEAKLIRRFRSGQRSLLALYCGYYLAELVFVFTENHLAMEHVFDALDRSIVSLDEMEDPAKIVLRFELEFLRELGQIPSFELCAACGNSVESGRNQSVLFGSIAGGVLCDTCGPGQRGVLRVSRRAIECLARFASEEPDAVPVSIPDSVRGEVRFVIERFLTQHCDRRLRLLDFLEDLRR